MSSEKSENPIYKLFPGQVFADLAPAAHAIGLAEQTARDKIWLGKFPVQTVKIGRKRLVVVADLARYYAELVGLDSKNGTVGYEVRPGAEGKSAVALRIATDIASSTPRPRGRPRKYPAAGTAAPAAAKKGGA